MRRLGLAQAQSVSQSWKQVDSRQADIEPSCRELADGAAARHRYVPLHASHRRLRPGCGLLLDARCLYLNLALTLTLQALSIGTDIYLPVPMPVPLSGCLASYRVKRARHTMALVRAHSSIPRQLTGL